jgi:aminomethyltransferase
VLQTLTAIDLAAIRYYWFAVGEVAGVRATVSRTGYTGEDGFEIFVPPAQADRLWDAILAAGRDAGVLPCGLGARDTLRLEAAMRLCGSDMDEETSVLEAGLGWIVGWKKDKFLGAERLREQKTQGVSRKLAAFEIKDRGIARHGHVVMSGGERVGLVTSGTQTPFLKKAIGFAMVPVGLAAAGSPLTIDVRGRHLSAEVVPEPFYKRSKA